MRGNQVTIFSENVVIQCCYIAIAHRSLLAKNCRVLLTAHLYRRNLQRKILESWHVKLLIEIKKLIGIPI